MKIGMIAPVWYPIPPPGYGGIELVVSLLTEGLHERGHDVTLFASGDSETQAKLVSSCDTAPSLKIGQVYADLVHVLAAYTRAHEFDIIHDHSGMIGPALGAFSRTPVLHTLHGPATPEAKELYEMLNFGLYFNAISDFQKRKFGDLNFVGTIYNAIDLNQYKFVEEKDDYLLFLGRMNPEKGAHLAVEVANRLDRRLLMVTKMAEPAEEHYFETEVKPLLNSNIEVLGEIAPSQKSELFAHAYCTLVPIQWPEPFGLVLIESLATGTPVIAIRNGAVPEIVDEGNNGFIVDSVDEMADRVAQVKNIKPQDCRRSVEEKFSISEMIDGYEAAYQNIFKQRKQRREEVA